MREGGGEGHERGRRKTREREEDKDMREGGGEGHEREEKDMREGGERQERGRRTRT